MASSSASAAGITPPPAALPARTSAPSSGVSDSSVRDYAFKQNVGISFSGESVLDNGLTVGAYVELRGQTQEDQIRKVYAYFSGGFGKVQFGDQDGALAAICYTVPSASKIFGADSPAVYGFNFSNAGIAGYGATNGTCYGIDSYSTQLVYFSPEFAGFQFAFSFTPDQTEDTRNTLGGAGTRFKNDAGQNSENLSMAGFFTHDFNGVNLTVGGAHTFSFDKENNPNNVDGAQDSNAYLQVGFAGFTIGGAMEYSQNFVDDERRSIGLRRRRHLCMGRLDRRPRLDARRLREGCRRRWRRPVQCRPRRFCADRLLCAGPGHHR